MEAEEESLAVGLGKSAERSHTSLAVESCWHGDSDVEVLELGLRETVDTWDVVGDSQVGLPSSQRVSGLVHITDIWASTIGIDLITVSI